MIFFQDRLLTVAVRMARCLALVYVTTASPPGASALDSPQRPAEFTPAKSTAEYLHKPNHYRGPHTYLAMIGPAPLCFAPAPPPLPPEPVLPTPPKPKKPPESAEPPPAPTAPTESSIKVPTLHDNTDQNPEAGPNSPKPVSILPDDTKTQIRPEDVLPFFQYPGANDSGAMSVPFTTSQTRGATTIPSSATYRQQ
jgi:hypothetical protein